MLILELAIQSVRGFSPSARVALKPGYIGLKSPTEIPAPLAGLFLAIAYPDGRGGESSFLAPGASSGRAGFSVQARDGTIWRLVRDLGGPGALHRLNPQSGQFEVVTDDAGEIAQQVRAAVGFPVRTTLEQVFTFTAGQLPTRRLKAPKSGPSGTRIVPAFQPQGGSGSPGNVEETRAKIAQAEVELAKSKHVAEVQFRLDGAQSEIYRVEQQLKVVTDKRAELAGVRQEIEQCPTPQSLGLPQDIGDRVRRDQETTKRFKEASRKLAEEREVALAAGKVVVPPLIKDTRFLAAFVGGLVVMLGSAFLEGNSRYFALLGLPAFTFATLLALRYIEELQFAGREAAKTEVFDLREKKLKDEYAQQHDMVQSAFEKVNATTEEEFFTALSKSFTLTPRMEQLAEEVARLEADPAIANLPQELAHHQRELEQTNAEVMELSGGYMRDAREIEREIEYLQGLLAPAAARGGPGEFTPAGNGPEEPREDPVPALMGLGADLLATDVPTLWSVMRDRVVQYLGALTDRRYHGVDVDQDGFALVQAPGREIAAGELPGRDLDLLYLALRLTLIEKTAGQARFPVIFEDSVSAIIEPAKQPLFGRMLKHLGTLTQVLHVTGVGQTASAADAVLNL